MRCLACQCFCHIRELNATTQQMFTPPPPTLKSNANASLLLVAGETKITNRPSNGKGVLVVTRYAIDSPVKFCHVYSNIAKPKYASFFLFIYSQCKHYVLGFHFNQVWFGFTFFPTKYRSCIKLQLFNPCTQKGQNSSLIA